jgi:phosphomannomutase
MLLVFDIDGTISKSKAPIDDEMAVILNKLQLKHDLGILSGASLQQITTQIISRISVVGNIWAGATSGAAIYHFNPHSIVPRMLENNQLSSEDWTIIGLAEIAVMSKSSYANRMAGRVPYGPVLENRGAQATFSLLGQYAPVEEKASFDPDGSLRKEMIGILTESPGMDRFDIRMGGLTSIDISKKGMDKKYGIGRLIHYSYMRPHQTLYFGDAFGELGNDYPVLNAGIPCVKVNDVEDTKAKLRFYL